jgi:HK97 gp10 family phage protein
LSSAVAIRGLDGLRKRFAALGAMQDLTPALRAESEAVAAAARAALTTRKADSDLVNSIRIVALDRGGKQGFAVGTDDPAGWFLEFGTRRRRAFPWLGPALYAHSSAVNQTVRKLIARGVKGQSKN